MEHRAVAEHYEREFLRYIFHLAELPEPSPAMAAEHVRGASVDWFTSEERRMIFEGLAEVVRKGQAPTDARLYDLMRASARAEAVSDEVFEVTGYLPTHCMPGTLTTPATAAQWLEREMERRRGEEVLLEATTHWNEGRVEEMHEAVGRVRTIRELPHNPGGTVRDLVGAILSEDISARTQRVTLSGYKLAYDELHDCIGPVQPGSLTVLGGNPGDGKSAVMLDMGLVLSLRRVRTAYISVEDPLDTVQNRLAEKLAYVRRYEPGRLTVEEQERLNKWYANQASERMLVRKPRRRDLGHVLAEMRECVQVHGSELLLVDYLNVITVKGASEYDAVNEVTNSLKEAAQELGVPLVLGAQLNRSGRTATEGPGYGALRGSGRIEESAENVLVLWRTGEYPNERRHLRIAKAKSGPVGMKWNLVWKTTGEMMSGLTAYAEAPSVRTEPDRGRYS